MFDFDWYFYIAKTILNYSVYEFWRSCPKELDSLVNIHIKVNGLDEENEDEKEYTPDQIPWL